MPLGMSTTKRLLKFSWAQIFAVVWRPITACLFMYFCVGLFDCFVADYNPWARLLLDSSVGAAAYSGAILALWFMSARPNGAERFCLQRVNLI